MSNTQKRADEIIEETMRELYDELAGSEKKIDEVTPEIDNTEEEAIEDLAARLEELPEENNEDSGVDEESDEDEESEEDEDSGEDEESEEDEEPEEDEESEEEESEDEKAERKRRRRKKALKALGIIVGILAAVYVGVAIFFNSHFMFNTSINGKDYSLKSVKAVAADFEQRTEDFVLTIEESDGDKELIDGTDISLEYIPTDDLQKLVKAQNNFLWITTLWEHPELETKVGLEYNKSALTNIINNMQCLVPENQVASVNAHPEFKETQFEIVDEIIGTQIDAEKFHAAVIGAIDDFQATLVLSETDCYLLPAFVSDSPEVTAARDAMNSYLGATITYDFNPNTEVVDSSVIAQWIKTDENMAVTFDENAVKTYIASLAEKYDTLGKARQFTTATGNVVTVEGGDYGWKIDQEAEFEALVANVKNAEAVTREPAFSSRAVNHSEMDMGTTYAEVDLTNQHMYFIKDGQVVLDSPVVTGNPNRGNATPQGVYDLTYKTRNAVLRGEKKPDGTYEYESPVSYWMPFNRGIGFHDATWQSSFGGSRYLTNGSHGCVNMPKSKAGELYELIPEYCPVVCHY